MTFASQVQSIASTATDEGYFAGNTASGKVWIATVWQQMKHVMSREEFEAKMEAARKSGELILSRADHIEGEDAWVVAESKVGTRFVHHLIRV